MDIPNLAEQPTNLTSPQSPVSSPIFSVPLVIITIIIAILAGFGFSRLSPKTTNFGTHSATSSPSSAASTDSISDTQQLVVGKVYGNLDANFKDVAQGTVEKGSINGEGTHILNRAGGADQRASLTSSTIDLDLFVGKKVEVKGQTNTSKKTGWLLDVGNIKILE